MSILNDRDREEQERKDKLYLEKDHFYGWVLDVSDTWDDSLPTTLGDQDYWYHFSYERAFVSKLNDVMRVLDTIYCDESRSFSPNPVWIAHDGFQEEVCSGYTRFPPGWMYMADTREDLVSQIISEWRQDKHLVGY